MQDKMKKKFLPDGFCEVTKKQQLYDGDCGPLMRG